MTQKTLPRNTRRAIDRELLKNQDEIIAKLQRELNKVMRDKPNFILLSDGYKYSHHKFYSPGTSKIYSYMESRGHRGKVFNEVVSAGQNYFIKRYLTGQLFTQEELDTAAEHLEQSTGRKDVFDKPKFQKWLDERGAIAPIRIKSAPEGMIIPVHNVLMTVENTDDEDGGTGEFAWVTNFLESLLLEIWYPVTVATISREVKKTIKKYFLLTSDLVGDALEITMQFILNDFGFRSVGSPESAAIGGMAHLINFLGSDNEHAADMVRRYYNTTTVYAKTIPATEHSIMTQEGEAGEWNVIKRVLREVPTGIVAMVMDSFNILRAIEFVSTGEMRDLILQRDGTVVLRPDSGDPVRTLLEIFKILFKNLPYTTNSKGFKVLPPQYRVIQGDGVNYNSIGDMYQALYGAGISAENLVLGMGGKLLQAEIDRDTFNFAFKCSFSIVNGREINVVKNPTEIDANGNVQKSFKKSKQGRLKLVRREDGTIYTMSSMEPGFDKAVDLLVTIFENGEMINEPTFEEIRERAKLMFLK